LLLPGLALLKSPRTKYSIAWLEISRSVKRHCHIWRTSMTLPKTSHQCDARQEDLQICTPQLNVNGSTTLHLLRRLPSSSTKLASTKRRHPHLWPTMTLGWIGLTSKYRALLGIIGTWSTSCDSCNCLLIALCVLGIVCSCFVCFFECVLLPCAYACACFWHLE
jgi:hypothetical protein